MDKSRFHLPNSTESRYERLSRLVQQYELGEITHEAFQRAKREVLLGQATHEAPDLVPIELLIAAYSRRPRTGLTPSVEALRAFVEPNGTNVLDAATVSRDYTGTIRIRAIPGLTGTAAPSVIMTICALLFPKESVRISSVDIASVWEPTMAFVEVGRVIDPALRNLGDMLAGGSASVLVVYRSTSADDVAGAFRGFDTFARRILSNEVAELLDEAIELQLHR